MKIHFGASQADREFTLDSETRQLLRDGREVRLSPKAFDVLCILVERRPKVVTKAELHTRIWPGTFVVDTNLSILVGEIRRAVSDTPGQARVIRTIHKIGYAFCAAATEFENGAGALPPGATRCWLAWNDQTFRLSEGDNIIGRDPDCAIWLDASGISRHHARIHIATPARDAVLEDLASTNGTFLRSSRLAGQQTLKDGDAIGIGSVTLIFRVWSPEKSKKTDRIRRRPLVAGGL